MITLIIVLSLIVVFLFKLLLPKSLFLPAVIASPIPPIP